MSTPKKKTTTKKKARTKKKKVVRREKNGRPRKYETVAQMQKAIDAYFKECDFRVRDVYDKKKQAVISIVDPIPYTIEGLALALGFESREAVLNYEKTPGYEEFFSTVKKAKLKVQQNKVVNGLAGAYNPAVTIFDLKNNHGYKDKYEHDVKDVGKAFSIPEQGKDE